MSVELAKKVIMENTNVQFGIFGVIDSSGYFPPKKFLNQFLMAGSDPCDQDGRMESWRPFALNEDEYEIIKEWWLAGHTGTTVDDLGEENWDGWAVEIIERM